MADKKDLMERLKTSTLGKNILRSGAALGIAALGVKGVIAENKPQDNMNIKVSTEVMPGGGNHLEGNLNIHPLTISNQITAPEQVSVQEPTIVPTAEISPTPSLTVTTQPNSESRVRSYPNANDNSNIIENLSPNSPIDIYGYLPTTDDKGNVTLWFYVDLKKEDPNAQSNYGWMKDQTIPQATQAVENNPNILSNFINISSIPVLDSSWQPKLGSNNQPMRIIEAAAIGDINLGNVQNAFSWLQGEGIDTSKLAMLDKGGTVFGDPSDRTLVTIYDGEVTALPLILINNSLNRAGLTLDPSILPVIPEFTGGIITIGKNVLFDLYQWNTDKKNQVADNEAIEDNIFYTSDSEGLPQNAIATINTINNQVIFDDGSVWTITYVQSGTQGINVLTRVIKSESYNTNDEYISLPADAKELVNSGQWEYSEKYDGYVNSIGEIYRQQISAEQDARHGLCEELTRNTFNLVDKNGQPFTWTITFERVADETIGKSRSTNAEFTDTFSQNLQNFANKFLDGSKLNNHTLHISYTANYSVDNNPGATQNYMQMVSVPFAYGLNIEQTAEFARIYDGTNTNAGHVNRLHSESDLSVDEDYVSRDIVNVLIAVTKSQGEGTPQPMTSYITADSGTTEMFVTLDPNPASVTGNFNTSTKLINLSK